LFSEGDVEFRTPPETRFLTETGLLRADPASAAILRSAFADCVREVAGPPLPLHLETAFAAAELVRHACWFLVSRGEPPEQVELQLPKPRDAADHLSADLLLRYLPTVERRARALDPADVLSRRLAEVLRIW